MPLDEHILQEKHIKEQKQQDLSIQTNLTLIPLIQDDDDRKKLIENLHNLYLKEEQQKPENNENVSVSFDETKKQIEKAKIKHNRIVKK